MRFRVGALAALLVLTGCAATVSGHGTSAGPAVVSSPPAVPAPSDSGPSDSAPSVPAPSAPDASPTGPSTPAASTGVPSSPSGAKHGSCPSPKVTAHGAPFCYTRPAGFDDYSTLAGYAPGWTYRTLISVHPHDLIMVLGYRLADNTDHLDPTALRRLYASSQLLVKGHLQVTRAGAAAATRVDGDRAFVQTGRYRSGVGTISTIVYAGHTLISIQCQSQAAAAVVSRACSAVKQSITIKKL